MHKERGFFMEALKREEAGRQIEENLAERVSRRLWPLDANTLRKRAQRRTQLEDFGDPPLDPALMMLTESLDLEANLHPLGRFLMHGHLLGILETRLHLAETWRKHEAELNASPIRRPVFITGMPRSGSTFLHELLSQDPDNRSPKTWEVMFPLPAPEAGPRNRSQDRRAFRANARLWWFRRFAPRADEVHPIRAHTPHECVAIHSFTLLSEEFVTTCHVPTYEEFLRSVGLGPAYTWEKRFLQHLQSHYPTKRWVLKSPDHVYALGELFSVFPDAVVIQTHRNPLAVLESSLQLTEVLRGLFGRPDRSVQLREREARLLAENMERAIRFRDRHPELADRFIDVNYSELVTEPLAVVCRIYQHLGCPLPQPVFERMRQLVGARSRYRRRRHPTLADLGLDATKEIQRFQSYSLRFGIPCRPEAA